MAQTHRLRSCNGSRLESWGNQTHLKGPSKRPRTAESDPQQPSPTSTRWMQQTNAVRVKTRYSRGTSTYPVCPHWRLNTKRLCACAQSQVASTEALLLLCSRRRRGRSSGDASALAVRAALLIPLHLGLFAIGLVGGRRRGLRQCDRYKGEGGNDSGDR